MNIVPSVMTVDGCLNPWDPQSKRVFGTGGAFQTLYAHGSGGHDDGAVLAFSAGQSDKAGSIGAQEEVAPTLRSSASGTNQVPTICMASGQANAETMDECSPTLRASQHKDPPLTTNGYAVRRLTPTECERLQGFPDEWTDIYDSTPDTPRYKAIGNSMAVPVIKWIGERIAMVDM